MLWGSNARNAHPIFFHHVLKALERGATLIVVDPRRTDSAAFADLWLGIDVGTDVALSNTMAREIIHAGLTHDDFIAGGTTGYDEYAASVEDWTLERGEAVTGVPAEVIREVAHAYATAEKAMICWTLGITEHHNAVDNVLSLINLGLLTGHVGTVRERPQPAPRTEQRPGRRRHGRDPEQARRASRTSSRTRGRAPGSRRRGTSPIMPAVRLAPHAHVRGDGARRADRRAT